LLKIPRLSCRRGNHLGEELKFTEARLEGNIKIFWKSCLFISVPGPKKAKEYISHGFAEATEQGNKTFSAKSNRKMRNFLHFFLSCMRVWVSLSSTPLSYTLSFFSLI